MARCQRVNDTIESAIGYSEFIVRCERLIEKLTAQDARTASGFQTQWEKTEEHIGL
jgi:hypothetical protein